MLIKICGVTRPEDADAASQLGATAVGMVFWERSPRAVTVAQAAAIAAAVPPGVLTVGVFVDPSREQIRRVLAEVPLGAIQLHGAESPEFAASLPWPVIKAIGLAPEGPLPDLSVWAGMRVLLDAHDPERRGGTGRPADWTRAAALAASRPVVLAGGLRPENIVEAVRQVAPAGVDVSSGVESRPGVKDHARLRAFIEAVRGVEA